MFNPAAALVLLVVVFLAFSIYGLYDSRRKAWKEKARKERQTQAAAISDFVAHFDALLQDQEDEIKALRQSLLERAKELMKE